MGAEFWDKTYIKKWIERAALTLDLVGGEWPTISASGSKLTPIEAWRKLQRHHSP